MKVILIWSALFHVSSLESINLDPYLNLPRWTYSDQEEFIPINLGEDQLHSGCMCREVPQKLLVCFGRDSCSNFPKISANNHKLVRFHTTIVKTLKSGEFDYLSHIDSLEIESNVFLHEIQKGTFRNLTSLRNMSISYNPSLTSLKEGIFENLTNLKELFLVKNGFLSVAHVTLALIAKNLPKLEVLDLNENTFKNISQLDFIPMSNSSLKTLNLVLCQIEYIHPLSLVPLNNLSALRIGENRFNSSTIANLISSSVKANVPLSNLNLFALGFRKSAPQELLQTIADSNITRLDLTRNQFEVITSKTFPYMPKIESLILKKVRTLNISYNAFIGMPNLRTLILSGNKLSGVPPGVLLEQLTHLDLSANYGNNYFPSYFSIGSYKFVNVKKLRVLNLSFNRINSIVNTSFMGLSNLKILWLKNSSIFHIGNETFKPLKNLLILNLENNYISDDFGLNARSFEGLNNLEVLLLGGCYLSKIHENTFDHLTSLTHLGLERNNLLTVSPNIFYNLRKLKAIDLSENWLPTWQEKLFFSQDLSVIKASNNKFTYLSQAMLEEFENLTILDLSVNPYSCDCYSFQPLIEYVKNNGRDIFRFFNKYPGYCVYPDKNILEYFESIENVTCTPKKFYVFYILPLGILLILISIISLLGYLYRWHIRYWLFLARLNLRRVGKIKNRSENHIDYQYDAFVSYSNEDRNFVIRLVTMLENYEPYLKLCVYERDFNIGSVISSNVLESVAKSRKTLLVISDSYARSQWCQWEVQIAEHHRLFLENDHGDSLIMIKLGNVADAHLTPTLKYLMKTRIYLEWNSEPKKQKIFWERLRNALQHPNRCN